MGWRPPGLRSLGAHRVVPSWFVLLFWSLVPFGVEIERRYLQLGGPTLALIGRAPHGWCLDGFRGWVTHGWCLGGLQGWAPHGWCLGGSVRLRCLVPMYEWSRSNLKPNK